MYMLDTLDTLIKRYTQRAAMEYFCAANIVLSLKKHRKPTSFEVVDTERAEKHTIFAKSVNDLRLWKRYYQAEGIENECEFNMVKEHVEGMQHFLLYKHKGKYRLIRSDEDVQKLHDMLIFSAIIRTAERQYAEGRIIDPEVRQRIATYLYQRDNNVGMAKAVGHARKHDEDVMEAIDTVYRGSLDKGSEIIVPIWTEQLPALPEGISHALSWYEL